MTGRASAELAPELSFIMPCFNEEEVIGYTIPRLVRAFERADYRLELLAVDNGSSDRTGEIIREFERQGMGVRHHRIDVNEGYAKAVLEGIPLCSAPWIGIIPADGQVDAEDVVRLYESVNHSDGRVLAKVYRRFRMDGPLRAVISWCYNVFMLALWPKLGSFDVNGSPKLTHRDVLADMRLASKDWLLDPEIMIKAQHMGVRVIEMSVFARMRERGMSKVEAVTCIDFVKKLLRFKFGAPLKAWRREYDRLRAEREQAAGAAPSGAAAEEPDGALPPSRQGEPKSRAVS